MSRFRVPSVSNSNIVVRQLDDPAEIALTNKLIFDNYVAANYWEANAKNLENIFLHSPCRKVIAAFENGQLLGTVSVLLDSPIGLPSDGAQADALQKLRAKGGVVAEISGLAIDRTKVSDRNVALLLLSYAFQYSYYYLGVDRLVASCIATHARFYETAIGCAKIGGPAHYASAPAIPFFYLITLDLPRAHAQLAGRSGPEAEFRAFMLASPHACHRFPEGVQVKRQPQPASAVVQAVA